MAPVHDAARSNDVEALRRLLDEDQGLIEAEDPTTPLCIACTAGSMEATLLLLEQGADINRMDVAQTATPLMAASISGRVEVAALLLQRGADPSLLNRSGVSALTAAAGGPALAGSDHVAVIRLLLKDGRVPVEACDILGGRALLHAAYTGCVERARVLLLEGGADHTKANVDGETCMAIARRLGHRDCVRLIQWYEGELHRVFLLSKARAVVDDTDSITKAPEKVQAKTRAQAQQAREEAAPAWLRGRVGRGEALPVVEVVGQRRRRRQEQEEEDERGAVCEWLVRSVPEDLYVEMMEGLTYRRWVQG